MPGFPGTPGAPPDEIGQGEEYELRAPGTAPLYDADVDVKIIDWRCDCFVEYGFDVLDASLLAQRRDVDRAHVKRLLDQGATHVQVRDLVL